MANWKSTEIVVELAAKRKTMPRGDGTEEPYGPSGSWFFLKTFGDKFRGRFAIADIANPGDAGKYASLPPIPGTHIVVDQKHRTIRAVDPLSFPENKAVLERANTLLQTVQRSKGRPVDTSIIRNASDDEIKTALWEMRQLVDDGQAEVKSEGGLPPADRILAMPGRVKIRQHEDSLRIIGVQDGRPVRETVYASDDELARMGSVREERVAKVPAGEPA